MANKKHHAGDKAKTKLNAVKRLNKAKKDGKSPNYIKDLEKRVEKLK